MPSVDESARPRAAASPSRLAKLLLGRGLVTSDQLAAATRDQRKHGGQLATALVRVGALSEGELTSTLHQVYGLAVIDPSTHEPEPEVLAMVPHSLARKHDVVPVSLAGSTLTIAMVDPANHGALAEIKFATGCDLRIVLASPRGIRRAIDRFYNETAKRYRDALDPAAEGGEATTDEVDLADLERATENRPLVKLVSALLIDAVERRASDIHIEPLETDLRIRFRVDGVLYDIMRPPTQFKNALTSRIKIMASLDIAERRLPQDGAIKFRLPTGKDASFRVSSLPTIHGEKLVLRLLDEASLKLDLSHLGLEAGQLRDFAKAITRSHGLVLITGPTGSGKSTTLYALLAEINDPVTNISTAEDPVELSLQGVN
ncbi:MAG: GspE/PulE family protein, partial [Candidatus Binatia bacterium]